jgi:hypothetical protein
MISNDIAHAPKGRLAGASMQVLPTAAGLISSLFFFYRLDAAF